MGSELMSERFRASTGDKLEEVSKVETMFLLAEVIFVSQEEDAGADLVVGGGLVEECWISETSAEDNIEGDRRS